MRNHPQSIPQTWKGFCNWRAKRFRLLSPLYGSSEPGDYWNTTLLANIENDLKMRTTIEDYSFILQATRPKVVGLMPTFVDDVIATDSPEFWKEIQVTEGTFEYKTEIWFNPICQHLYQKTSRRPFIRTIIINETSSTSTKTSTSPEFRSCRGRLTWIQ